MVVLHVSVLYIQVHQIEVSMSMAMYDPLATMLYWYVMKEKRKERHYCYM